MAEGAAMLVLATESAVRRLGLEPQAELLGYAMNSDGYHMAMPSQERIIQCMKTALAHAALSPEAIDYYNAHGTSTTLNDQVETQAIKAVFGDHARRLPVSSIKGALGHGLGAAAAIEAAACVRALRDQIIPPTINYLPDPELDLDYVPNEARPARLSTVMSASFGFGGTNNVLILGRAETLRRAPSLRGSICQAGDFDVASRVQERPNFRPLWPRTSSGSANSSLPADRLQGWGKSMERRGRNIRKGFLKRILPFIRWLPLTTASGVLSGFGKLEYRLHRPLRNAFLEAVGKASEILDCDWDVPRISRELAGNQILWRTRDLLLDGVSDQRADEMFIVSGREHLDAALARARAAWCSPATSAPTCCRRTGCTGRTIRSGSTWSGRGTSRGSCPGGSAPTGPCRRTSCSSPGRANRPMPPAPSSARPACSKAAWCSFWPETFAGRAR